MKEFFICEGINSLQLLMKEFAIYEGINNLQLLMKEFLFRNQQFIFVNEGICYL